MRALLVSVLLLLPGGALPAPWGAVAPPGSTPPINLEPAPFQGMSLQVPYDDPQSPVGTGTLELFATPESNELDVRILAGGPSNRIRLKGCPLQIGLDGQWESFGTVYAGRELSRGAYDAVVSQMSILKLRQVAAAASVDVRICDIAFRPDDAFLESVREFVREFDARGTYDGPPPPPPPLDGPGTLEPARTGPQERTVA